MGKSHFILQIMKTAFVFLACAIVALCAASTRDDHDIPVTEFTEDSPVDELDQEHTATHVGSKYYDCSRILHDRDRACPTTVKNWSVSMEKGCKAGVIARYRHCKSRANYHHGHYT